MYIVCICLYDALKYDVLYRSFGAKKEANNACRRFLFRIIWLMGSYNFVDKN